MTAPVRVGLVSDTHGLFDARLPDVLGGCQLILHAGDVVQPEVLRELERIAPVRAVRGNNDSGRAFRALPDLDAVDVGELRAVLVHIAFARGRLVPEVGVALRRHGAQLLVHGHSHRPVAELRDGVLLVNPGSAGPRRFRLPRSAGILEVSGRAAEVRLFDLAAPRIALLAPPVSASW